MKKPIIEIDDRYYRPTEVDSLKGIAAKAKRDLKWKFKYSLDDLIDEMIYEYNKLKN